MSSLEKLQLTSTRALNPGMEGYDADYAARYIHRTLGSAYNIYKNTTLASLISNMGFRDIVDIGSNVSGLIRREGSLRYQAELRGVEYRAVDVDEEYFNPRNSAMVGIPKEDVYSSIDYQVASVEKLPFEDASIDAIVCADVIEHVPNPKQAFSEIARTLNPKEGRAFMIIPSMYKLDLLDFKHIDKKRRSSHNHKLSVEGWESLWKTSALTIDQEYSRPMGIASGLSYFSWLNDDFVPKRDSFNGEEVYSEESALHKKAKEIFAVYDAEIDATVLSQGFDKKFTAMLQDGHVHETFSVLQDIITKNVSLLDDQKEIIDLFFVMARKSRYDKDRLEKIRNVFRGAKDPSFLLGNSMLIVLKHRDEKR